MGWLTYHKEPGVSVRDELSKQFNYDKGDGGSGKVVACSVKLRTAYLAYEVKAPGKPTEVIGLVCLLGFWPSEDYNFGYKDMSEDMGPCESDCPAAILDMLTPTTSEYALEWRKRCRERLALKTVIKPGAVIKFKRPIKFRSGDEVQTFRFIKGSLFSDVGGFSRYRISSWQSSEFDVVPQAA